MQEAKELILQFVGTGHLAAILRALVIMVIGFAVARFANRFVQRVVGKHLNAQRGFLAGRAVYYAIVVLVLVTTLRQFGFEFTVLLGAAGVLTVAVGFASQTSASNVISGLFLMVEEPFSVGDIIRVGSTAGEVLSIDLLSVKLRTFDNLFVRVPNETMIKSEITNLTRFPIRRVDVMVGVAYKEDVEKVQDVLAEVAEKNPLCLEEPEPFFAFQGYGESSLDLKFGVWCKRENYIELRNTIHLEIKRAFDAHDIEIPFPHRSLYAGSVTDPFPVRVVPAPGEEGA